MEDASWFSRLVRLCRESSPLWPLPGEAANIEAAEEGSEESNPSLPASSSAAAAAAAE
jgi:hypothetical protein